MDALVEHLSREGCSARRSFRCCRSAAWSAMPAPSTSATTSPPATRKVATIGDTAHWTASRAVNAAAAVANVTGNNNVANLVGRDLPGSDRSEESIIGYRDCCGKEGCYRTLCYNNKDSLPTYRITADNAVFLVLRYEQRMAGQLHHGGEARGQVLSRLCRSGAGHVVTLRNRPAHAGDRGALSFVRPSGGSIPARPGRTAPSAVAASNAPSPAPAGEKLSRGCSGRRLRLRATR
jgi:hypothetical protein